MRLRRPFVLFVSLVAACSPKPGDTGGESGSEGVSTGMEGSASTAAATTTTATMTTATLPTSSASGGTTGGSTSDGSTEGMEASSVPTTVPATSSSTGPDETGSTTDGPGEDPLMPACEAMCQHVDECVMDPPRPTAECVVDCVNTFGGAMCAPAAAAFWMCVAELSCEDLMKFMEEGPASVCMAELAAIEEVCEECGYFGSGGGGGCTAGRDCGTVQEYACEMGECTCIEDGVPGKTCPGEGVCMKDIEDQHAAAEACCGWNWP